MKLNSIFELYTVCGTPGRDPETPGVTPECDWNSHIYQYRDWNSGCRKIKTHIH